MRQQRVIDALVIFVLTLVVFVLSVWVVKVSPWSDGFVFMMTVTPASFVWAGINVGIKCANADTGKQYRDGL